MAISDQNFIKRLRETFRAEAQEHLQTISSMLLELEKSPPAAGRSTAIETVCREAHSLKGASRAVDQTDIEAICQALEGVFLAWKREPPSVSAEAFDTLHRALDSIRELVSTLGEASAKFDPPRRDQLIGRLSQLQSPPQSSPHTSRPAEAIHSPPPRPIAPPTETEKSAVAVTETVRIPVAKLDARLLQAEEMLPLKARASHRAARLREMAASVNRWWQEWAKVAPEMRSLRRFSELSPGTDADAGSLSAISALVHFTDWNCDYLRSLESKLASLLAESEQDRRGIHKQVDDLLDSSKKLLMLPFSTMTDLYFKLVRDLCRDQGKEAQLTIEGGDVGIDKRILEEMKEALVHVLRNSIDHGVERPEERKQLKKPPRATIAISVSRVNSDKVEIRISDDGAGVDLEKLKKAAISQGILSAAQARVLDEEQALSLVFQSGVSTSPNITEISGRGLGMAIVRAKAEALGGKVAIQSRRHEGSTLRITLPLTLTTFRGILVSAAGQTFVFPAISVERALRVKPADIQTVENREIISLQGRAVSLVRLEAVLELAGKSLRKDAVASIPILVLHTADRRLAVAVDEVLREEEVLVKPFRKPLAQVRNLAGATVLASGKAVPVLNVTDLMKSAQSAGAAPLVVAESDVQRSAPSKRVLVVEDSITSRTLLKGILESENYQVKTAVDGVDAFTVLREEHFDLVVSDVEMPRMNGLDLTAKIRADQRLAELPIVLVTALESRQERERGIDVGANAYIVKSSFDQSSLLEVVRRFV